jgi:hypothetical protein
MNMISLRWDGEEGMIKTLSGFEQSHEVVQIDALTDWIYHLSNLRDSLISGENTTEETESEFVV